MNSVDSYKSALDAALSKVNNNSNYFASFGDIYIAQKTKEYLDNIAKEIEKTILLIDEIDKKINS